MAENSCYTLKIDEDFRCLIPPHSAEERQRLEESLIHEGCRKPLCVWNETILDGYERYDICMRLRIPFKIAYVFLKCRKEAIAWVCANTLRCRNVTDEVRKYLIGKRFEMERAMNDHTENPMSRIYERFDKEYHISPGSLRNRRIYARAIDALSSIDPKLVAEILSGNIKLSHKRIIELSRLSSPDAQSVNMHTLRPRRKTVLANSIKNMPLYDPDAEILSLTLTIPSWIGSMSRACSATNFSQISNTVRHDFENGLINLISTIDTMMAIIKRSTHE